MSATIFWKKDEPDESQIKEVNVPGVFPRPSSNVYGQTVTALARPWLRTKKVGQQTATRTLIDQSDEKPQQGTEHQLKMKQANEKSKKKIAISLKDLSGEDKRRVANLIKELAKAGEERKLAINALHEERIDFQGKEELLKQEQEKLIMERDELREKILEYQFLINQYSNQIQQKQDQSKGEINDRNSKGSELGDKYHSKETDSHTQLHSNDNLRGTVIMKDPDVGKIPTYYSVAGHEQREFQQINPQNSPKKFTKHTEKISNQNLNTVERFTCESLDNSLRNGTSIGGCDKHDVEESKSGTKSIEAANSDFIAQNVLLTQQNALLEQQKCIQEQLAGLKELHKKYMEDISYIAMQQISPTCLGNKSDIDLEQSEKPTTSASKDAAVCTSNYQTISQAVQCNIENLESIEQSKTDHETVLNRVVMEEEVPKPSQAKSLQTSMNKEMPNDLKGDLSSQTSSMDQAASLIFRGRDLLKSNELRKLKYHQRQPNSPDTKQLAYFKMESPVSLQAKSNISRNSRPKTNLWEFDYENFEDFPHRDDTDFDKKDLLKVSSRRKQKTSLDTFLSAEPSVSSSSKKVFLSPSADRKQSSLLNIFDEIDHDMLNNEELQDSYELGSYLGFAKNILQGKTRNENIFASTDQSDTESEEDENELLSDVFYLHKF
eukprot:gene172-9797_t